MNKPLDPETNVLRTLLVDEVDEFSNNLSGGDDPLEMLKARTSAFPATSKHLHISTPQIKGLSRIEQLWLKSDQRRYHVPCPHCGHMQHLEWAGLHWTPDARQCWYVCQECGANIGEHHKTQMIRDGQWVPANPGAKARGYHINCLYYQFGLGPRWLDLIETWRDVQNEPARLKTFLNDRLAEPWEDAAMRAVKHNAIADRAEPYPLRTAPHGVLVITAGIDTQDNRLAVQIIGWGRGMAFWALDYVELPGDPASGEVWTALTVATAPRQSRPMCATAACAAPWPYSGPSPTTPPCSPRENCTMWTGAVATTNEASWFTTSAPSGQNTGSTAV